MQPRRHPRFTPQLASRASGDRPATAVFVLRSPALGFEDQPLADVPILPRHLWRLDPQRWRRRGRRSEAARIGSSRHARAQLSLRAPTAATSAGRPASRASTCRSSRAAPTTADACGAPAGRRARALRRDGGRQRRRRCASRARLLRRDDAAFNLTRPPFDRPARRGGGGGALDLPDRGHLRASAGALPADRGMLHPQSPWAVSAPARRDAPRRASHSPSRASARSGRRLGNDPVRLEAAARRPCAARRRRPARLTSCRTASSSRRWARTARTPGFDVVVGSPGARLLRPGVPARAFGSGRRPLNDGGYRSTRSRLAEPRRPGADDPRAPARRRASCACSRAICRSCRCSSAASFAYRAGAYDGWVDVRGSGILDKRSFLAREIAAPPRRAPRPTPSTRAATVELARCRSSPRCRARVRRGAVARRAGAA